MKNIFQPKYIAIAAIIIVCIIILFIGGNKGTSNDQAAQSSTTSALGASSSSSSAAKTSGQTYYNYSLGFSFTNPHPTTWIMSTNNSDGSLVYFGPKIRQAGVGLKVYYWPGPSEFPTVVKITTIQDLKNAVVEKYKQVIPSNIVVINTGGFYMVEVKGLTNADFSTTNAYFVLLPSGTLNFGGAGSLSGYIHKI